MLPTAIRHVADDDGATAVEYALLVVAVAAVSVAIVVVLGEYVFGLFDHANSCVQTSGSATGC